MLRLFARRILLTLVTLLGVALLVFVLVHLSGDPVRLMLAETGGTQEDVAKLKRELGYDRPLPEQFAQFVLQTARGNMGKSLRFHQPAMGLVLERIPATLELATVAMLLAMVIALPLGIAAAVRRGTVFDRLAMLLAMLGQSIPLFWLGISMVLLFAVVLRWLPAGGRGSLAQMILPAVTLATYPMGRIARMTRSSILEVLRLDYVRTARAKGLPEWRVTYRHALRNALLPVVTLVSLQFGSLLGGAVVTEVIFSWPGLGQLALQAVTSRDLPLVQAVVLVTGTMFILVNTTVDLLYGYLDPRIRWQ